MKFTVQFENQKGVWDQKTVEANRWSARDGFIEFLAADHSTVWAIREESVHSIEKAQ